MIPVKAIVPHKQIKFRQWALDEQGHQIKTMMSHMRRNNIDVDLNEGIILNQLKCINRFFFFKS